VPFTLVTVCRAGRCAGPGRDRARPSKITIDDLGFRSAAQFELRVALEVEKNPRHHQRVSKVEQMEAELRKLSQIELRQIRAWLDDLIEDELEFTPEFEALIQEAESDMAGGKSARVREP
jgi:hypothetical protein